VTFYFITKVPKSVRAKDTYLDGKPRPTYLTGHSFLVKILRGIRKELESSAFGIQRISGDKMLARAGAVIYSLEDMERKRRIASEHLSTSVAFYSDEVEQLIAIYPELGERGNVLSSI
jgi:hypothetical protein